MATQTDKVIVDVDNGTFLHIEQLVLVDLNELTEEQQESFREGDDDAIAEIAEKETGKSAQDKYCAGSARPSKCRCIH